MSYGLLFLETGEASLEKRVEDEQTEFQPRPEAIRPGVKLNGIYEIERLVAEGGMGQVYRAFNVQTRDPVAIKMIRAELSGDEAVIALFRREASTLFNLHHEAIVRYFVFSVDPELRRAYLAMEFVEGPSLATRIAERPLSVAEARTLLQRVGAALDKAHSVGVIHRDLSPDNIILPDGDARKAKLIDFGIARSLMSNERTIVGDGFAGKMNYVSPEQLGLGGGEVTGKSDIYSFGLVIAGALSGRALDMKGSQLQILEKRRRLPDLSGLPPELAPALKAMLQPNPGDRPGSMADVVNRLATSSAAGGPAVRSRGREAAAVAALLIAGAGGLGLIFRDDIAKRLGSGTAVVIATPASTPAPAQVAVVKPAEPAPSVVVTNASPSPALQVAPASPAPSASASADAPRPPVAPAPAPQVALAKPAEPAPAPEAAPSPQQRPSISAAPSPSPLPTPSTVVEAPIPRPSATTAPTPAPPVVIAKLAEPAPSPEVVAPPQPSASAAPSPAPAPSAVAETPLPRPLATTSPTPAPPVVIAKLAEPAPSPEVVAPPQPSASAAPSPAPAPSAVAETPLPRPSATPTSSPAPQVALAKPVEPTPSPEAKPSPQSSAFASPAPSPPSAPAMSEASATPSPAAVTAPAQNPTVKIVESSPTPSPSPIEVSAPAPAPSPTAIASAPEPAPSPSPTVLAALPAPATHVPGPAELLDAKPPAAPAAAFDLPTGVVGKAYRAETPAFADPGGKGLTLSVQGLPEGLAFADRGGGVGEVSGTPAHDGAQTFIVTAANRSGRTAQMSASINVFEPVRAPEPSQSSVNLAAATVGRDYHVALPGFSAGSDPSGLVLKADPQLPDGLVFADRGAGAAELSGRPTKPGAYEFNVLSRDSYGPGGRMRVDLTVAPEPAPTAVATPRPPMPSQPMVLLADAVAGKPYDAALPPFRVGADPRGLRLSADPSPPEGMTFADAGGGLSLLSGQPARPGVYAFDIVSRDGNGPGGRMAVKLTVAPPPVVAKAPQPAVTTAMLDPLLRTRAFLKSYDGGGCYFAGAPEGSASSNAIEAVAADVATVKKFEAAFQQEMGSDPNITVRLISPGQCPLVELMRLTASGDAQPPTIQLAAAAVGPGHPLTGRVTGLAGRHLQLVIFDNDGDVLPLKSVVEADGDAAVFEAPLKGDAASAGKTQILSAIVSTAPLAAFSGPRPTTAAGLVSALRGDWGAAGAAASTGFFRLVK